MHLLCSVDVPVGTHVYIHLMHTTYIFNLPSYISLRDRNLALFITRVIDNQQQQPPTTTTALPRHTHTLGT